MPLRNPAWVPDFLEECGNWPQGTKDQVDAATIQAGQ